MTLRIKDLAIRIGDRVLVQPTSWTIGPGECWAVLGPNGAGKSLLLHTLAALEVPRLGSVLLDDKPVHEWVRRDLALRIGVLLQDESADYWGSVRDYVALGRMPHRGWLAKSASEDDLRIVEAIDALRLTGLQSRRFRTLSGGERQRARIAQLIAQAPDLLLLDEPLNHLDLAQQILAMTLFSAHAADGGTVVCTLHDPTYALRHCSHALLMYDAGRLELGPVSKVVTRSAVEQLYGCRLDWPISGPDFGPFPR
ncbi:MAG: ABC transporter ATP-binding protein [Burkholderiales bacterium]